jgi:hypothetical protein
MQINKFVLPGMLFVGCMTFGCNSGSNTPSTPQVTTVKTTISDPAACQAPNGQYAHVYVTVTDVQASTNGNAGTGDSSFVDLTPTLKAGAPMQIDLLGQANNNCFLASLGSTTELPAGNYQQIRIMLAPDSAAGSVSQNACGSFANCVVLSGSSTPHDLALSSEAKTGLKIPSGQIEGGQFVVGTGQTEDLDVDFNTCVSIIEDGNGQFRLKPVLHAGEVSTTSTSINGTILNAQTSKPIVGGTVVVAVEQTDSTGVDRVLMTTVADPVTGGFVFCPLMAGTYDIVAVAVDGSGIAYSVGVETGLQPGNAAGNIPLVPAAGTQTTINGMVTSLSASTGAISIDARVAPLQQATASGLMVTVPLLPSQNATDGAYVTETGSSCPSGTDCVSYTLKVPAVWPNTGAYAATGAQFTQSTVVPVADTVDVLSTNSAGTPACSTSEIKITNIIPTGPIVLTTGGILTVATAAFTGC